MKKSAYRVLATLLVSALLAGASYAIDPGFDLLLTTSASMQFATPEIPPIPADFFGPGSDPFDGAVTFGDGPLSSFGPCPFDDLGTTDTIVHRPGPANIPLPGNSATIPIEIVELRLESVAPIVVTFNGGQNPQLWDVAVDLSVTPQLPGQMFITRDTPTGGTFDATLPVAPRLHFTPSGGGATLELDWGLLFLPALVLETLDAPWVDQPNDPGSCESDFALGGPVEFSTPLGSLLHAVVDNDLASTKVPVGGWYWLLPLAVLVGLIAIVRRRRWAF